MSNKNPTLDTYQSLILRKRIVIILVGLFTLITALIALSSGSIQTPLSDIVSALLKQGNPQTETILYGIRLPRVVAALLVGSILGVSGAVMQCVLQNPLASSSTLGVSQGAAFGAALGIIVFGGGVVNYDSSSSIIAINNPYIVTLCAFVFGSLSTFVIIILSRYKKDLDPAGLILAGVALSSLFAGGSALLQYFADETKISTVVFWTFGNLGSAGWHELLLLSIVFIFALFYFLLNRWNYNAMESGADTAKSLGVNTKKVTLISMCICSLATAFAVSCVGIISFVGLIAPHIMRRFIGNDYRYLIPASAVTGSLILILADTFARLIIAPVILPIGAITSFLGAPFFLALLLKGVKSNG